VVNTLQTSNLIVPAGTARMGTTEYNVFMNSSPPQLADFEQLPMRISGGVPTLLGEVARVRDAFADQTNIVHVDGHRATYLAILRHEREAVVAQLDAQESGLLRQIASDERAALASWQAAAAALQSTREVLSWASEGLHLAQLAWNAGASTNLEVVDAERRARDAATAVIQAEDALRQSWLETLVARGVLP
jgi:hypothetical protein